MNDVESSTGNHCWYDSVIQGKRCQAQPDLKEYSFWNDVEGHWEEVGVEWGKEEIVPAEVHLCRRGESCCNFLKDLRTNA